MSSLFIVVVPSLCRLTRRCVSLSRRMAYLVDIWFIVSLCRAFSVSRRRCVLLSLGIAYYLIYSLFSYRCRAFSVSPHRCFAFSPYRIPYRYFVFVSFVVLSLFCRLVVVCLFSVLLTLSIFRSHIVVMLSLRIAYYLIDIAFSNRLMCFLCVDLSLLCFLFVSLTLLVFRFRVVCRAFSVSTYRCFAFSASLTLSIFRSRSVCRAFSLSPHRCFAFSRRIAYLPDRYFVLVSFVVLSLCRLIVVLLSLAVSRTLIDISFSCRLSCFFSLCRLIVVVFYLPYRLPDRCFVVVSLFFFFCVP